jgi:predicted nuclease of predicted toxin-antitoxin system
LSELKFYFDESVELAVSEQLLAGGLDVVSVHSLDKLGDKDPNHLKRASEMGRILRTYDTDFLQLAVEFIDHNGIIFAQASKSSIGGWVREIRALHARLTAEDAMGQVIFLSTR